MMHGQTQIIFLVVVMKAYRGSGGIVKEEPESAAVHSLKESLH